MNNMNRNEIERYLADHENGRYERDHWDKFVSKKKLTLNCPVIHITGTNGKGSTANYISHIYKASGRNVGLFIKPFFYHVNEMFSVNGVEITDQELEKIFNENLKDFEKYNLSAFEIEVFIGYTFFNSKKLDLAIIECGMGGAIDATNIETLPTVLAIITSLSLEHTGFLGTTVSQIALNKVGILKEGVPLLVGAIATDSDDETSETLLRQVAKNNGSKFILPESIHHERIENGTFVFDYFPYKELKIATEARYMLKNASLAIEAIKILQDTFPVDEVMIRHGLLAPTLPGRFERHGRVFIDGAHNPEAVSNLVKSFPIISGGAPIHVLFASFRDKNIAVEFPMLGRDAASITLTTFDHPRARNEMDYFIYSGDYPFVEDWKTALTNLLGQYPEDVVLIAGSLTFAGLVRKYLIEENIGDR